MAVLLPIVGTLITVYCILAFNTHRANLTDPKGRERYIERLQQPLYITQYRQALGYGLSLADRAFSSVRPFSLSAYLLCTEVSFAYSLFGFLIAWAAGGPGKIGSSSLLPEAWDIESRTYFATLVLVSCCALYLFTFYPFTALQFVRHILRRSIKVRLELRTSIALMLGALEIIVIFAGTHDIGLTLLFIIACSVVGLWLGSLIFMGGASIGVFAAYLSTIGGAGSDKFVATIAVVAAVALGASHGTKLVAAVLTRHYRQVFPTFNWLPIRFRNPKLIGTITPIIIFAVVGMVGGAAFMAGVSRAYAAIVGADVDSALIESLGIDSRSPLLPAFGALAGLIGGALAAFLGEAAVLLSSFVCSLLLIGALGTRALSPYKLYEVFGSSSFVGSAMINVLLFFIILPPINAFWDWVAWEGSRVLGRKLYAKVTPRGIVLHSLAALILGLALLVGLTVSATLAITFFNQWMATHTNTLPLPIRELAFIAAQRPLSVEGLWITTMLFSTLIPVFFHLTFLALGTLAVRTPASWRSRMIAKIRSSEIDIPVFYFMFVPMLGMGCVVVVCWLIVVALSKLAAPIGVILLSLVYWASS